MNSGAIVLFNTQDKREEEQFIMKYGSSMAREPIREPIIELIREPERTIEVLLFEKSVSIIAIFPLI